MCLSVGKNVSEKNCILNVRATLGSEMCGTQNHSFHQIFTTQVWQPYKIKVSNYHI